MNAAEKLEGNMKSLGKQNDQVRLALLEQSIGHIGETLQRIEGRLNQIEGKIDKFDSRLWTNFYWLLGTIFTVSAGLAGIMAQGFKWFN